MSSTINIDWITVTVAGAPSRHGPCMCWYTRLILHSKIGTRRILGRLSKGRGSAVVSKTTNYFLKPQMCVAVSCVMTVDIRYAFIYDCCGHMFLHHVLHIY